MTEALINRIKKQLARNEALLLKPYRCTANKLTIGIGRNLEDRGVSQKEAYSVLEQKMPRRSAGFSFLHETNHGTMNVSCKSRPYGVFSRNAIDYL